MIDKIKNPVDVYVGSRLKLARVTTLMSQTKLGDIVGVTFQQIQKYEKGVNRIGASRLYEFSKILGITVQYFFEEIECNMGEYIADDFDGRTLKVVKAFNKLPESLRKPILKSIQLFSSKNVDSREEETEEEDN